MPHVEFRGESRKKHRHGEDLKPPPWGQIPAEDRGEITLGSSCPHLTWHSLSPQYLTGKCVRRLCEVWSIVSCSAPSCPPSHEPEGDTSLETACLWVHSAAPRSSCHVGGPILPWFRCLISWQAIRHILWHFKTLACKPISGLPGIWGREGRGAQTIRSGLSLFPYSNVLKGQLVIIVNLIKLSFLTFIHLVYSVLLCFVLCFIYFCFCNDQSLHFHFFGLIFYSFLRFLSQN